MKLNLTPILYGAAILLMAATVSAEESSPSFSYRPYARVLERFVDDHGLVDYAALAKDPADLDAFLKDVADLKKKTFDAVAEKDRIAFWINVYNAYTLKTVVKHYPIKSTLVGGLIHPGGSIRQISGVWDKLKHSVMGREMTLDQIEHGTLRAEYHEPRIHFAINCASMGCPKLFAKPYVGDELDRQLDEQVRRFLHTPEQFQFDRENRTLSLSMLLKWYAGDFASSTDTGHFDYLDDQTRGVMNFLYPYLNDEQQAFLKSVHVKVRYLDYDWSLNEQS
ncbi:MAG: DUF547 domain-containing protein [bacterium]|nr:DUF547 domain-containing protein [bacterium]